MGKKTHLHLTVNSIASADGTRRPTSTTVATRLVVAPVAASLAVGTIAGHVSSIATDATDDVGCKVALLRAVVLAVSDLTTCQTVRNHASRYNIDRYRLTVLASLILIVTESTVESSQLTKLVALEFVLTFGNGSSLEITR